MDFDVETMKQEAASEPVQQLLARLASLPGVSAVNPKPQKPATKPNHFGVSYKLRLPGADAPVSKRSAVTEADGIRPTFIVAVQAAIDYVITALDQVGGMDLSEAVDPPIHSAAELAWLEEWCEEHPNPETITMQMAEEALLAQHASSSGSSALLKLQETQLLRAQHRAAERRLERARTHLN